LNLLYRSILQNNSHHSNFAVKSFSMLKHVDKMSTKSREADVF